jgi:RIO kinase 1
MHWNDAYPDEYELYEEKFDPLKNDRQARRNRKPRAHPVPRKEQPNIVDNLTDEIDSELDGGFRTTYQPSRYEATWLLQSLRPFYDQTLITDVLALVKGGKEASVYRCRAHPSTGLDLLAAKVYRPRKFRILSNDAVYREGRAVLNDEGHEIKATDERVMKALRRKTGFGLRVAHTSWVMHEFTTLQQLYAHSGAVPQPILSAENALLMGYQGDEDVAAPTLHEIDLERDEAESLFDEVMRNVELLLGLGWIHGDLSAYNILYWEGEIVLIDFPQVVSSRGNDQAHAILERDITRVCDYFARQGVKRNPAKIIKRLWYRYAETPIRDRLADASARFEPNDD